MELVNFPLDLFAELVDPLRLGRGKEPPSKPPEVDDKTVNATWALERLLKLVSNCLRNGNVQDAVIHLQAVAAMNSAIVHSEKLADVIKRLQSTAE